MSSDPESFGVVADGIFDGNYDEVGKSGALQSNWAVNKRGNVPTLENTNPNQSNQIDSEGNAYLLGIFIHRSNKNGGAGAPVSKGCLLILPGKSKVDTEDWNRFNEQMSGVNNFKVEVNRSEPTKQPRFKR